MAARLIYTGRDAHPVPRPREECASGKLGWFSEADAWAALRMVNRRPRDEFERQPRSVYRCECGSWHLTGRLQGERGDV